MRSKVHTTVKMSILIFCVVTPYDLQGDYHHYGKHDVCLQGRDTYDFLQWLIQSSSNKKLVLFALQEICLFMSAITLVAVVS
jgi:hypothetical protein